MTRATIAVLLLTSFPFGLPAAAEPRVCVCYGLATEPVLDGSVADDPAWRNIPEAGGFVVPITRAPAGEATSFRIGHTPDALFLAITCAEASPLKADAKDGESGVFADDSIEVFLFPEGNADYFQLVFNGAGARFNLKCRGSIYDKSTPLRDWQVKTRRTEGAWSAEMRVPYAVLDATAPRRMDVWTGNVGRNDLNATGSRNSCWAYLQSQMFHQPACFGKIVIAGAFSPAEQEAMERHVVRQYLASDIEARLASVTRRKEEISGCLAKDSRLNAEFASLVKEWESLAGRAGRRERASLDEAEGLLAELRPLGVRMSSLKGKALRENLFR
jgi:hypothetical protein